ncbi:MAG: polyprenyl synthetase family protein, partial [Kiritimatiellae bacterium]|nr:polyprenyl synthetase family protein [Kiritimatiellia bacterium]
FGVVRGQVEDVARESGAPGDRSRPDVDFIYRHKTADLFSAAAKMGALSGGGDAAAVSKLAEFGRCLGLAFQYEDDLLDGDGLCSPGETARLAAETTAAAVAALEGLPGDASFLRDIARGLVGRGR